MQKAPRSLTCQKKWDARKEVTKETLSCQQSEDKEVKVEEVWSRRQITCWHGSGGGTCVRMLSTLLWGDMLSTICVYSYGLLWGDMLSTICV